MIDTETKARFGYLSCIAHAPEEKAELLHYLSQLGGGKILEIGPGAGTAVAAIVRKVETEFSADRRPEVVVFDVIADVFDQVKELIGETDVSVKYVVGDGSKRLPFDDASVAAVNCSAVAHECFSYGGGYSGIHRLASECGRIIQPNGVMTYRDPDGIELHSTEEVLLSTPFARLFLAYFLPRFLDRKHTRLPDKVDLGYLESLAITMNGQPVSISELTAIDPTRFLNSTVSLHAKAGLVHEIQRHLVLFAKEFGVFEAVNTNELGDSLLQQYASFEVLNPSAAEGIEAVFMESGTAYLREDDRFKLTPAAFNLMHTKVDEISARFGTQITLDSETRRMLDWGTREGEENYFYGSSEEIVARFAHFSLVKDGSGELGYSCLCPISTRHIKTIERPDHSAFLRNHLERGSEAALSDRKRHIHFVKIPLERAFPILLAYYQVKRHPALLETLQAFMFILKEFSGVQADLDLDPTSAVEECVDLCSKLVAREEVHQGIVAVRSVLSSPHLGLVGGIASGKTTIGQILSAHGYVVISFSAFIKEELDRRGILSPTREDYFRTANGMRANRSRDILARLAIQKVVSEGIDRFVFDGMRNSEEIDFLRRFVRDFILIGVETSTEERIRRVLLRLRGIDSTDRERILGDIDREFFDPSPDGCRLSQVMSLADVHINGNLTPAENKIGLESLRFPNPSYR